MFNLIDLGEIFDFDFFSNTFTLNNISIQYLLNFILIIFSNIQSLHIYI